jgi:hypothetical protein
MTVITDKEAFENAVPTLATDANRAGDFHADGRAERPRDRLDALRRGPRRLLGSRKMAARRAALTLRDGGHQP